MRRAFLLRVRFTQEHPQSFHTVGPNMSSRESTRGPATREGIFLHCIVHGLAFVIVGPSTWPLRLK